MKIILKEDVINLGYKDDVVEVKNGYARNYLIPQGKAIMASPSALKVLAENLRQRAHKIAKIKADAEAVAETMKGISLTIATPRSLQSLVTRLIARSSRLRMLRNLVTTLPLFNCTRKLLLRFHSR